MKEELITFNTAILAKEKGFNIYQTTQFSKNVNPTTTYNYDKEKCLLFGDMYYAPTQSLLQKWLREKHNIHINIVADFLDTGIKFAYCIETKSIRKWDNNLSIYEEALEIALFEGLKLIP